MSFALTNTASPAQSKPFHIIASSKLEVGREPIVPYGMIGPPLDAVVGGISVVLRRIVKRNGSHVVAVFSQAGVSSLPSSCEEASRLVSDQLTQCSRFGWSPSAVKPT